MFVSIETLKLLDRNAQASLLVGQFLQRWALMESELNEAIAKTFGLTPIQLPMIAVNVNLQGKIYILRSAVRMSAITKEASEKYDDILKDIATYAYTRNMMAHDMFFPDQDSAGVRFFVVKAKGELKVPRTVWSIAQFLESYQTVDRYREAMTDLAGVMAMVAPVPYALAPWPTPSSGGPGLLGLPILPIPEHQSPDTNLANFRTDSESPPSEAS